MKQKIRNWVLIASSCFIFVFLATPGVFAQGSNFRAEFDSYLTRFGFGDQGITSDADRAIRREFVQFIGNGSVNLDELEPEELDRLLADPVRRERLVNSFTTYHQSGALPEPTYAPPASSALNESTTIVPDVNDPTKSDFQLIPANCYGSGDTAYVETKNKGGCGW